MNAYTGDTLLYRNFVFELEARPLEGWFELIGSRPTFRRPPGSVCDAPDYSASWEIDDDGRMCLVGLVGAWVDASRLALAHLFPFAPDCVIASWFSGPLRGRRVGTQAQMSLAAATPGRSSAGWLSGGLSALCGPDGEPDAGLGALALELRAGRVLDAALTDASSTDASSTDTGEIGRAAGGSGDWTHALV